MMKIDFYLRFHTKFGQSIAIVGNIPALGSNDPEKAYPLTFFNEELWHGSIEIDPSEAETLHYRYLFTNEFGEQRREGEKDRKVSLKNGGDVTIIDSWNDESFYENAFYTTPFTEVYFKDQRKVKVKKAETYNHVFKVKAPLLSSHETLCLLGGHEALSNWDIDTPVLLHKKGEWWTVGLNLDAGELPVSYKYCVYDIQTGAFSRWEGGDNRILYSVGAIENKKVVHDGFARLPNSTWKGAGVAIPVFALRTNNSFGIGEFSDIRQLVDWSCEVGLKLIQLLPVNDTSATLTWKDSYPYAAISAFALHPVYINLQKVAGKKHGGVLRPLLKKQKQLNQLTEIDYEQVINFKLNVLRELYELNEYEFLEEDSYREFFEDNKSWLVPYAAFSVLRDRNKTADYSKWKMHSTYNADDVARLTARKSKSFKHVAFYYFVQYHLHLQLREAVEYAHKKSIALKGDIPIGIYRYGCDAWTAPELYNMDMQAGAPPDDFAIKGQNWGFPTYNWKQMEADHFEWWRQRFHQMSNYFDAFRIDHILGFFRIWSIPIDAVEGIMGRFIPALPVHVNEFGESGIWFDYDRFCKPYIVESILEELFGEHVFFVKQNFLHANERGGYDLKEEFDTQRKVEAYFLNQKGEGNDIIRQGLYDLISNVLLFEEPGSDQTRFHFRISIEMTSSFQHLDEATRYKLQDLYINYFYRRQDGFWKKEALHKLPALKDATNMLICGEDLGMVPHSVPEVMKDLGILSLEVQRMPKNPQTEFFHPKNAPYLSVVTPSSHDMSTIRGWWEEDREKTQRFFNHILGEEGEAPVQCEPWINRAVVLQHLYSPAMWSIFQVQDLLGMSDTLRRENTQEERINEPANSSHYWNYRMHLPLEQLLKEKEFNKELMDYITHSGR